ncbi:MAG: hypothetical protein ACRYFU_01710 [Janthinobacterium lividum]
MKKFVRSFALVSALTLAAAPALRADQTGCNPHPQANAVAAPSTFMMYVYVVMSYFGA